MPQDLIDRCLLVHPAFTAFGPAVFRRAETDETPMMVVSLGERSASLPLRALQREFQISDHSPDGQMLGLIAEALNYVGELALGDALPGEVLDGVASWQPERRHQEIAAARLRGQLLAWLRPDMARCARDGEAALLLDADASRRTQIQQAFEKAAQELGMASPALVVEGLEALAEELSYIEALRDRFLGRVKAMARRLGVLAQDRSVDSGRLETLTQVQRLTVIGLRGITTCFAEIDGRTDEVLAALRNADSHRSYIRSHRDLLYRRFRLWEAVLAAWDRLGPEADESFWAVMQLSYRFLAQHFMPATEWPSVLAPRRKPAAAKLAAMTW